MFQRDIVENIKTHTVDSVTFFFFENLAAYEIIWKTIVEASRPHMTIWCMRITCWIPKAKDTLSENV
jgi:hypothetical protein